MLLHNHISRENFRFSIKASTIARIIEDKATLHSTGMQPKEQTVLILQTKNANILIWWVLIVTITNIFDVLYNIGSVLSKTKMIL